MRREYRRTFNRSTCRLRIAWSITLRSAATLAGDSWTESELVSIGIPGPNGETYTTESKLAQAEGMGCKKNARRNAGLSAPDSFDARVTTTWWRVENGGQGRN